MHYERGDVYVSEDGVVKHRKMTDEELKSMLGHIRLNTGFSLPDQLIQDFMNDGTIVPSFKKCMHFNRNDFNSMVQHLKIRKKKLPPKKSKRKRSKSKGSKTEGSKPEGSKKPKRKRMKNKSKKLEVESEKTIK